MTHAALINWAKSVGEAEDYRDNLSSQCIHPVGHWYEMLNLLLHNIDTLGANADPAVLGYHIQQQKAMTVELITRKLDDRGGGLAKINGQIRLVEGLALPDEKIEFNLSYYNSNTFWIDIEFLWSEEMADACVYLMEHVNFDDIVRGNSSSIREIRNQHINIGTGKEISVKDLAFLIKEKIGFNGELVFNTSKPDGTMRKLTDPSKIHALGWHHKIEIDEGIKKLYRWYLKN